MGVVALLAQAPLQDRKTRPGDVVLAHPRARVVPVPVGDHRPFNRPPRIDEEVALGAIKAFAALDNQVVGGIHARNIGAGVSAARKASRLRAPRS